jgi:hypothetical protein
MRIWIRILPFTRIRILPFTRIWSGSHRSVLCTSGSESYLSLWCGSGSYLSFWCGSGFGSYHSLFSWFGPSNAPNNPLGLPPFKFAADPDPAVHFDADPDPDRIGLRIRNTGFLDVKLSLCFLPREGWGGGGAGILLPFNNTLWFKCLPGTRFISRVLYLHFDWFFLLETEEGGIVPLKRGVETGTKHLRSPKTTRDGDGSS